MPIKALRFEGTVSVSVIEAASFLTGSPPKKKDEIIKSYKEESMAV